MQQYAVYQVHELYLKHEVRALESNSILDRVILSNVLVFVIVKS